MSQLGAPQTKKATIGTFEFRVGPMSAAGLLTPSHSVGIIDAVKLDLTMDSVDLLAGFPQQPADTAITKFVTGITGTLREQSRRNLNIILGNGLFDYDAANVDQVGFVDTTTALAVGATAITMQATFSGTLNVGDFVVIYDTANPGNVNISRVATFTAKAGATPASLTLDSNYPLVAPSVGATNSYAAGSSVKLYKTFTVPGGAITGVPNYFAVQLIRLDRGTGRPVGFNFWKCAISGGGSINNTVTEFGSFDLQLKALMPAVSEYATGGILAHAQASILANPVYQLFDVPDSATS